MSTAENCAQCGYEMGDLSRCPSCGSAPASGPEYTDTDIANSERFVDQHGQQVRYTPERGWLVWGGTRWCHDEKTLNVQELAKRTAKRIFDEIKDSADRHSMFAHARRSQSRKSIESMIWLARSHPAITAKITDFDQNAMLFNTQSGTLDLLTGDLRPHCQRDLITNLAPVTFDANAQCPRWLSFLNRVTDGDRELAAYLRCFVGYLLAADVSDQSLHFLYGRGANGKSVFCEVIQALLGDYAIVCSPDLIMVRRHGGIPNDVARLRGVRAALMNETSQGSRFDEAKLKDLTGGDTLNGRFLFAEFFDFSPTHRIIIRGNHRPMIAGTDEGIWRRLRLVPFTVSIPPDEQDRDLLCKLKGELPGILNWALAGCLDWQRAGLKPPAVITDAVRAYRDESDTLGRFISERCTSRHDLTVKSATFFARYYAFAHAAGETVISQRDLPLEMDRRGFTYKRDRTGTRLYVGIALGELSDGEGK